MNSLFKDNLFNIDDIDIMENEPMKNHTTFRIGGPARYFVTVFDTGSLLEVLKACIDYDVKYMVVGNGSNLLVSCRGYDGVVIKTEGEFQNISVDDDRLTAGSGVLLPRLAKAALGYSLKGLEFASGIPGSVGGGILMNAGAYDGEIRNVCAKSRYVDVNRLPYLDYDRINEAVCERDNKDLLFDYRMSIFQKTGDIILDGTFQLEKVEDKSVIEEKMKELNERRRAKQPLEYQSAGSTFKRPKGNYAAKLIEECGLKGYSYGDAQVSEKHSGFVINRGNASFNDVVKVIEHVKDVVYNMTGVILEPEVKIIW
ncbi:MAG TPA: UDP-N-acetylmuramate dehydrogenase [Clostridia bacterium]|nr:UDP-N-acetylmuramate dehydrogenase [Clostridia bacterium]